MEERRYNYLINNYGLNECVVFGRQVIKIYRNCVINRLGMCSSREGRIKYIKSYLFWKIFVRMENRYDIQL